MTFKLWCDAGSKGNPGYCYGSYLIEAKDTEFRQERSRIKLLDYGTNNQAEYLILIKALEQFRPGSTLEDELFIFTDSRLMVQQVRGRWKTRVLHIKELRGELLQHLKRFGNWTIGWVPREEMVKRFGH